MSRSIPHMVGRLAVGNRHSRCMRTNIPKFEETHAETGFDRECASSNPLTPASHSCFERISLFLTRKARPCGLFLSSKVSRDRRSHFFSKKFPKVSSRIQENSRLPETGLGKRPGGRGLLPLRRWSRLLWLQPDDGSALQSAGSDIPSPARRRPRPELTRKPNHRLLAGPH
jgi:hypothetical protein